MTVKEIFVRLIVAAFVSGCIGYEREFKNRPAGIRTHILVCVGATIIALIQQQIMVDVLTLNQQNPEYMGYVRSDPARLIAQVVSGVGFLGAGTIIFNNRNITGLTTAASLWASAGLGLAFGMGYYKIGLLAFVIILFVLILLQKIVVVPALRKMEIQYVHRVETKEFLTQYFEKEKVIIRDVDFSVDFGDDYRIYKNIYTIELPKGLAYPEMIEAISVYKNVQKVTLVRV